MNYLLIGKPNVGKSSIFNILTSSNRIIVHAESGTTRDWHMELIKGSSSYIFDTPGILINENNKINLNNFYFNKIKKIKINSFLYVINYHDGYNEIDHHSINILRKNNKEIILIINKFDNPKDEYKSEFLKYGINKVVYISCAHKYGIDSLKSLLALNFLKEFNKNYDYSLSIFGKPNVGKSTFLNALLGYKRSTTSHIANTTSDYVEDYLKYKDKIIKVIDTAGIGKKSKIKNNSINYHSIKKSFSNIIKVDSSLILINSTEGIDRQDKRIIKLVSSKSKLLILIYNKIDLINNKNQFRLETIKNITNTLSEIRNIKVFFISSFNIKDVKKIMKYTYDLFIEKKINISTSKLNQWLKKAVNQNNHPLIENKRVNFKYVVQIKSQPLTIKIFCNHSDKIKPSYKRYLINNFNINFEIINQKTNLIFSSAKNPYI